MSTRCIADLHERLEAVDKLLKQHWQRYQDQPPFLIERREKLLDEIRELQNIEEQRMKCLRNRKTVVGIDAQEEKPFKERLDKMIEQMELETAKLDGASTAYANRVLANYRETCLVKRARELIRRATRNLGRRPLTIDVLRKSAIKKTKRQLSEQILQKICTCPNCQNEG